MKKRAFSAAVVAVAVLSSGCVAPTPYQAVGEGRGAGFGYTSTQVEDALFRVSFRGNGRTDRRAIGAYALYRSAEIARDANAPAFHVLEGTVDRTVLEGDDKFANLDGSPFEADALSVARLVNGSGPADHVIGARPLPVVRTAGFGAMRMPMPAPRPAPVPRTYAPTYVYTSYGPVTLPETSLLVRMLQSIPEEADPRVYLTQDVLARLGPRIVRKPE